MQCQSLDCQLQEARLKLAAEKEESKNAKRRVEFLEIELTRVREQVDSAVISSAEIQRKCNKQEVKSQSTPLTLAKSMWTRLDVVPLAGSGSARDAEPPQARSFRAKEQQVESLALHKYQSYTMKAIK